MIRKSNQKFFVLLAILVIINLGLQSAIVNIPGDFVTIQEGIYSSSNGDTVLVQPGIYIENIDFIGKSITVASLYLISQDSSYIAQTIIDGGMDGHVVKFNCSEDKNSVLSGFTIKNGFTSGAGGGIYCCFNSTPTLKNLVVSQNNAVWRGGGIYCDDSSPDIENIKIINNSANAGGGIYCYSNSSPHIKNSVIKNNCANYFGGGVMCLDNSNPHLENVSIIGNFSYVYGGGIYCYSNSSPLLDDITLKENSSESGGGLACFSNSTPSINNSTIIENTAIYYGGGIYLNSSPLNISNTKMIENLADYEGGGIFFGNNSDATLENVLFLSNNSSSGGGLACSNSSPILNHLIVTNNTASNRGGGLFCHDSSPVLQNVTIAKNICPSYGAGIHCQDDSTPDIVNCIIAHNYNGYGIYKFLNNPPISIQYSNFYNNEGGNLYGFNDSIGTNVTINNNGDSCDVYFNITMNPCFVDTGIDDYHLAQNSPCIDAGDPDFPLDPDGTIADLGFYYYNQNQTIDEEPENFVKNSFISYPNPFIDRTTIRFNIPHGCVNVSLDIYNTKAQLVRSLPVSPSQSRTVTVVWNGKDSQGREVAPGIYLYKLEYNNNSIARKMIKLK